DRAARLLQVVGIDQPQRRQAPQRVIEVGYLLADQLELVGGFVVGEYVPVTVQNQPAAGGDRIEPHAIALRELDVIVVAIDLQVDQAADQRQRQQRDDDRGAERALRENALLVPAILDAHGRGHGEAAALSGPGGSARGCPPPTARAGRWSRLAASAGGWIGHGRSSRQ